MTSKPILCLVPSYSEPGLPRPTSARTAGIAALLFLLFLLFFFLALGSGAFRLLRTRLALLRARLGFLLRAFLALFAFFDLLALSDHLGLDGFLDGGSGGSGFLLDGRRNDADDRAP